MSPDQSPFTMSMAQCVPLILKELIQQTDQAMLRLGTDSEALHDFRVGLRHIRSWLKSFGGDIGVELHWYQQVTKLTAATNDCRDLEVYVQWLDAHQNQFDTSAISVYNDAEHEQLRENIRQTESLLAHQWPEIRDGLMCILVSLRAKREEPFVLLASERLRERLNRLQQQVELIVPRASSNREFSDACREMHKCRIRLKHIRYLLEGFVPWHEPLPDLMVNMKAAQDVLGRYHDLCEFTSIASQVPGLEMQPLIRIIEQERQACFAELRQDYLQPPLTWLNDIRAAINMLRGSEY